MHRVLADRRHVGGLLGLLLGGRHAMRGKLSPKQVRFVQEYLIDLNGTMAYRAAGYKARNDNVAAVNASNLIRNSKVAAALMAAQQARQERVQVDQDYVIKKLRNEVETGHHAA